MTNFLERAGGLWYNENRFKVLEEERCMQKDHMY